MKQMLEELLSFNSFWIYSGDNQQLYNVIQQHWEEIYLNKNGVKGTPNHTSPLS